jgi:hypothetical protein
LRTIRFVSVMLALVGAIVILTGWIDWPWWAGVGLGSPLGFLLFLDDDFAANFDIADGGFSDGGDLSGDGGGGGGDGGGGG